MKSATNSLTNAVIKYLNLNGFNVWRQNQVAAPGRRFVGILGLPDVIGYHKNSGQFISVEIKTGKDKLSLEQIEFGINALEGGCLWYMTFNIQNFIDQIEKEKLGEQQKKLILTYRLKSLKELRDSMILHERKRKKK